MGYITVKEAAEKSGVTPRHVQILCAEERIKGATRFGRSWMIPRGGCYGCKHFCECEDLIGLCGSEAKNIKRLSI